MIVPSINWLFCLSTESIIQSGYRYSLVGREIEYRSEVERIINEYKKENASIEYICEVLYYMHSQEKEQYSKHYNDCKNVLVQSSGNNILYLMEAMYHKFDENYEESSKLFKQYIDSTGITQLQFGHISSEVFRKAGKVKEAMEYIDLLIKEDSTQALYLLELARVEHAEGDTKKAKKTIGVALDYWKDADSNYKYLLEAQEFQKSLE